jgi:hypothetical protein
MRRRPDTEEVTGSIPVSPTQARALRAINWPGDCGPLAARTRLQVQRPELVKAEDHSRLAGIGSHLTVGDGIQVLDPCLLHRIVRVLRCLPGLQPLKGDALLPEQHPKPLVADVVDHPLSDQELGQLRQALRRERQVMLSRPRPNDLLDLPPLREGEFRRPTALVPRIQGGEPVGVEVADTSRTRSSLVKATLAIAAASMPWADSSTICAGRQVTTDPLPRRTIRRPSSSSISRTRIRSAAGPVSRTSRPGRRKAPDRQA